MQEENWKRRLPQSWRKESCKKEGVINNVKWHGDEIKKQDIFMSLMAFAEAGSVRWWKQQWVEGHFKQKDRDREHELLFPKPGSEGGEQDVLEICQRKLVVLAYSVLMMALMIKKYSPCPQRTYRSTGEGISPTIHHSENNSWARWHSRVQRPDVGTTVPVGLLIVCNLKEGVSSPEMGEENKEGSLGT